MARTKGSANFAGSLEVLAGAPLDARSVVPTKADLTTEGNFPYKYIGMEVYVTAENKKYRLINADSTSLESWEEVGGSGGQIIQYEELPEPGEEWKNKIIQYIGPQDEEENLYRGYFYACGYYTRPGSSEKHYFWNPVPVQDVPRSIQTDAFPQAQSEYVGLLFQYVGSTTENYTHGYFYECVEDEEDPGNYLWKQVDTQPAGSASTVSDLTDVNLTDLADGQVLKYDAANEEWINADETSGGQVIQYEELPLPSEEWEYKIIQYVGPWDPEFGMYPGYFYECVENEETPGEYEWKQIDTQPSGGSGSSSLQRAIVAAVDVGGIEAGDEFLVGTPYDDMWDALLNPTLYPTFTAPSASLSYSADTYYEVKSSVAAKTATASLNRGSISPAYGTSGYRSGTATGYAIATSGADTEYSDSSASSGTFNVPALTRSTKGNIVLTATVSYAAGEQPKDSKGNNYDSPLPAGSKTASKTLQFIQAYFYGKSSTPTVSSFSGLSKSVTAKGEKKFSYTTNNEYMVIAYDSSYGNLKTILDPNSFDVTSGWTKSTLTVDGFTYYVYVANSPTTDTNAQFTFKY